MVEIQSPSRLLKRMTGQKQSKPDRDREWSQSWAFILVEGYCFIDTAWSQVHDKYHYQIVDWNTNPIKTKRVPNQNYDPTVKRPRIPKYCKKGVGINCLENKCPHLCFTEAEEKMCIAVEEAHDKLVKEEEEQWEKEEAARSVHPEKSPCNCNPPCETCNCTPEKGVPHGSGKPRSRTEKVRKERHGVVPDTRDEVPDGGVGNQSK